MKILYLADGGSIHTYKYIKYFYEKGNDITLFSMRPVRDEISSMKIKIIQNKFVPTNSISWMIFYIFAHLKYYFILKKIKADIIHVHDVYRYGLFGLFTGKKYILTPWGTDILIMPNKNWVYKKILPKIFSNSSLILYEGKNMFDELLKFNISKKKLKSFCFGVDIKLFSKNKKSNFLKNKYKNKTIIISTRNLEPIYNIETLILSANLVIKKNKKVIFLIVGEGSEKNKLINLVKNLKLSDNVVFLGKIPYEEMPKYCASSDIYISTSLSDSGLSCSTAEAMSCGLASIITDFGSNSDWVKENENGFLFKPKDFNTLTNKILYLIDNPIKIIEFGKKNSKIIYERNNYYNEMEKISIFYEKHKV